MEQWYIPITILPGVGLLLLSTSNLIISLNDEIKDLLMEDQCREELVEHKIRQLSLMSYIMILLYLSAGLMVLAGISDGLLVWGMTDSHIGLYVMLAGALLIFISITLLILYSTRAVKVRKEQYSNFIKNKE